MSMIGPKVRGFSHSLSVRADNVSWAAGEGWGKEAAARRGVILFTTFAESRARARDGRFIHRSRFFCEARNPRRLARDATVHLAGAIFSWGAPTPGAVRRRGRRPAPRRLNDRRDGVCGATPGFFSHYKFSAPDRPSRAPAFPRFCRRHADGRVLAHVRGAPTRSVAHLHASRGSETRRERSRVIRT